MLDNDATEEKLKDYARKFNYLDETVGTLMNRVSNLEEALAKLQPKPVSKQVNRPSSSVLKLRK